MSFGRARDMPSKVDYTVQPEAVLVRSVSKAPRRRFPVQILCARKRVSEPASCWPVSRVNELMELSTRPGLAVHTSQPQQTSAAPVLPVWEQRRLPNQSSPIRCRAADQSGNANYCTGPFRSCRRLGRRTEHACCLAFLLLARMRGRFLNQSSGPPSAETPSSRHY
jgi:hypothetical protein